MLPDRIVSFNLTIIKYLDESQIRGKGFLADNAGYYEAIEMNNVDVLRVLVETKHMKNGVTKGFDLAYPIETTHCTRCIIIFQRYNMGTTSRF
jgi:hypothetical protein